MKKLVPALLLLTLAIAPSCRKSTPPAVVAEDTVALADTAMNKIIIARVYLKPEHVNSFTESARAIIDSSSAEAGCISYMLYQNPYDKTKFVFVEEWKDQAAIDYHFSMSYFGSFGELIGPWVSQPTEISIYDAKRNP